ncbi:hypothetical protein KY290_029693 [Solanum tuberosum]|uniref:Uncharacterized protein n=2 Tax=Solanum TaxID=4107 RepID=A0ABQ7ULG4_SOLTU|nr:hypothetical protein KY289_027410 [Solanum tuberosum]KAH0663777.1 hypothetical protein KY284_028708 [Solanum tuberosum]KAH0667702.1 hypothetical protein KY285_028908 [Solanum tuberosum]KAH0750461.1 hypothetical protein KY290_029693 [Solanum tuberosum]
MQLARLQAGNPNQISNRNRYKQPISYPFRRTSSSPSLLSLPAELVGVPLPRSSTLAAGTHRQRLLPLQPRHSGLGADLGWNPVMAHQLTDSLISIHSWTLQVTSYPHMESAQGRNPIQWVTGTGLDIKDREKRISAKKENCLGKQSQGKLLASALPHH